MLEIGYFPDVNFTSLPPRPEPEINKDRANLIKSETSRKSDVKCEVVLSRLKSVLHDMSAEMGIALPLDGRSIYFLPEEAFMQVVDQGGLRGRYSEYIINSIVGYTRRFPDGTFDTFILGSEDGRVFDEDQAVITLGHEYGHTIGPFLGPLEEEVKAYAFQSMFLKYAFSGKPHNLDQGLYPTRIHDVAKNRIAQLKSRDFPMEAVIAHLNGQNFGNYRPDSNMSLPH